MRNSVLTTHRFLWATLVVFSMFAGGPIAKAQEQPPPVTFDELSSWLRMPEAERPSEEIIETLRARFVEFPLSAESDQRLRNSATIGGRPIDLVRQVVQAAQQSWVFDRIKVLAAQDQGLEDISEMIRTRGLKIPYSLAYEQQLRRACRKAGSADRAFALLWPPIEPDKPRFRDQLWRTPRGVVVEPPLRYDPDAIRGRVEFDVVVDGEVMFVLKHANVFYNVICGKDVDFRKVSFSTPIPRVPIDALDYGVEISKKRGKVFACPQDKLCKEASEDKPRNKQQSLCSWEDLEAPQMNDSHGYPNARLVIDDSQHSGAGEYVVTFVWAVRPYTLQTLLPDLVKYGPDLIVNKIYARGAIFRVDEASQSMLTQAGASRRVLDEINRNFRSTNYVQPKVH